MTGCKLTELQKDALKEVGNIGAGHAATALSQLLDTRIHLTEPRIDVLKYRDLAARIGYEGRSVVALHTYIRGDAPGQMLVLLDRRNAIEFVRAFLRRVIGDVRIFDATVDSTLKELASLIAAAYLAALIQLAGVELDPSSPTLAYGAAGAAFRSLMAVVPDQDVFVIESVFVDREVDVSGRLILIPEKDALRPLLAVFGAQ